MSIMDLFKSAPAAPVGTAPTIQQKPTPEPKLGDSPITKDAEGNPIPPSGTPVNPLDAYSKMFENASKSSSIEAPAFKLDPKVLGEVSTSMDFTKGVQSELMDKALQGHTQALLAVIQSVGRNAYSASLEHATALTETHLGQRAAYETQQLNKGVKQQLTSNALSTAPNYNHPVVKAELNRVAAQFASGNPDASPQEIATAAQKYITDLSAALAPASTSKNAQQEEGIDWEKYLKS